MDILTYKLYMNLYADYSLCDKRYCQHISNEGNRFVLLGEITHGAFCLIMTTIILYFYFINYNELYIYLSALVFSAIQFALIIWYLASVFVEMKFVKNEQFWSPPLLWNVPWIIIPLYIIYYGTMEIKKMGQSQPTLYSLSGTVPIFLILVSRAGLEPATTTLKVWCSTR